MQERVHQTGVELEVRRDRQVRTQGMGGLQGGDGLFDQVQRLLVLAQSQLPENRLHQLHPGAPVAGVEHHRHDTLGVQAVREGLHPDFRIGQVMQDAGRHDEIEALAEAGQLLDREQMQLKVFQRVLVLEIALVIQRRPADIDRHHLGGRVGVRQDRRLVGAAAGHENVEVWLVGTVGPQDPVRVAGIEPLPVVSEPALKILDRFGVGPFLVLACNHVGAGVGHLNRLLGEFHRFWV